MAISVTVTATKIDITSTAGVLEDWDDVVTAVNAVTAGTITGTGTSGDPYIITCPSGYREVEFSGGVRVNFVANTYIEWANATAVTYMIDLATTAELYINEGCNFNLSTGASKNAYMLMYGKVTITGTVSNRVVFENHRLGYWWPFDAQDLNYVDFKNVGNSAGYLFYCGKANSRIAPICSYKNIRCYNDNGNIWGRAYIGHGSNQIDRSTFENIEIYNCEYFYSNVGSSKLKNVYVHDTTNYCFSQQVGKYSILPYRDTDPDQLEDQNLRNQAWHSFEDCEFDNVDSGVYGLYLQYQSVAKIKNCTFKNQTYGLRSLYDCRIILLGTNTFTGNTVDRSIGDGDMYLYGHEIAINIQDTAGNPIENALMYIEATNGKDKQQLISNSNGDIKDAHGDDCAFIEKHETSLGVFTTWDDYDYVVFAEGYVQETGSFQPSTVGSLTIIMHEPVKFKVIESGVPVEYPSQIKLVP